MVYIIYITRNILLQWYIINLNYLVHSQHE